MALAKALPKFTKWIDDVLKKKGKGARKVLAKIIYKEEDLLNFVAKNNLQVVENDIRAILKITRGRADLCESILLSTKEIIEDKSVESLIRILKIKKIPNKNSLSNYQVRIWYTWKKASIKHEIQKITDIKKKAQKAFDLRNKYRTDARKYMSDRALADYLEEVETNQEWESYTNYIMNQKKLTEDNLWNYVIEKAQSGRDDVDKLFKLKN